MGNLPIKAEDIQLLNGLKPYLGTKGQALTDRVLSMIQLLTSESIQQALEAMVRVMPSDGTNITPNKNSNGPAIVEGAGAGVTFEPALILFLILVLLMQDWGK